MATPESILARYWGYGSFRSPQEEIIKSVLENRDTMALLPTGGGKSLCFQIPALIKDGVCLVISPLIALMQDQVQQLKKRKVAAVCVHSGMSREEIDILLDNCVYGNVKLLYLSPERLETEIFQERYRKMNVSFLAVDEAHCISQWGYDFRPAYLKIGKLREEKRGLNILALTASATGQVKADIIQELALNAPAVFQRSFARPNLSFVVRKTENKQRKLLEIMRKVQGPSIVYVRSRKATQETAAWLVKQNVSSTFYHAGLTFAERTKRQEEWIHDKKRVMVATNAFGMGINKADVRTVVHLDLPESMESYYQEAGRAGRDGKRSYAALIYHDADVLALEAKVNLSQPGIEYIKKVYQALANFYQLAVGAGQGESFDFDLDEFCNRFSMRTGSVYPALKKLQEEGFVLLSESFYRPSKLHIGVDKVRLYEFQVANSKFDLLIKAVLRLYGAELFSDFLAISESQLARAVKTDHKEIVKLLTHLHELQLFRYQPATEKPQLTFVLPRQDSDYLPLNKVKLEERRKQVLGMMKAMADYATEEHRCRQEVILDYFNEQFYSACGTCDVCIAKKKKENLAALADFRSQVFYLLNQKPLSVEELEDAVSPGDHDLFIEVVREMVDEGVIAYDEFWILKKV